MVSFASARPSAVFTFYPEPPPRFFPVDPRIPVSVLVIILPVVMLFITSDSRRHRLYITFTNTHCFSLPVHPFLRRVRSSSISFLPSSDQSGRFPQQADPRHSNPGYHISLSKWQRINPLTYHTENRSESLACRPI
jgi:hypothetical protein